jgi:hypothetical protein
VTDPLRARDTRSRKQKLQNGFSRYPIAEEFSSLRQEWHRCIRSSISVAQYYPEMENNATI